MCRRESWGLQVRFDSLSKPCFAIESITVIIDSILLMLCDSCRHPEVFGAVNTIEGFDVVGEVIKLGSKATDFVPGDKVVTFTRGIGPRKLCLMSNKAI